MRLQPSCNEVNKISYEHQNVRHDVPALGRSGSGMDNAYRAARCDMSINEPEVEIRSRYLRRRAKDEERASSISRTARSVAAFSITAHAKSKLSAHNTDIACSTRGSKCSLFPSKGRKLLAILTRSGSLQVTKARLPVK